MAVAGQRASCRAHGRPGCFMQGSRLGFMLASCWARGWVHAGFMLTSGFMLISCWLHAGFMLGFMRASRGLHAGLMLASCWASCWLHASFMLASCWLHAGFTPPHPTHPPNSFSPPPPHPPPTHIHFSKVPPPLTFMQSIIMSSVMPITYSCLRKGGRGGGYTRIKV